MKVSDQRDGQQPYRTLYIVKEEVYLVFPMEICQK